MTTHINLSPSKKDNMIQKEHQITFEQENNSEKDLYKDNGRIQSIRIATILSKIS